MPHVLPIIDNSEVYGVSNVPQHYSPIAEPVEPPDTIDDRDSDSVALEEADAALKSKIQAALHRGSFPLRSVSAIVTQRRVLLIGWVSSYYLKQVAQESVRTIPSIRGLANRLVVTSS